MDATSLSVPGSDVELIAGKHDDTLDVTGQGKKPLLIEATSKATTLSQALANEKIKAGSFELVEKGAKESGDTIAGGTLDLLSGATASGTIAFGGTSGTLEIGGTVMPANEIAGFGAHEVIELAGVKYVAEASVTVAKAGVVTIEDGGKAYNLNIAGVVKGEAEFTFGPGSVLTTTVAAKMAPGAAWRCGDDGDVEGGLRLV